MKQVFPVPSPCLVTVIQDPALINYPEPSGRREGICSEAALLNSALFVYYDLHASLPPNY